MKAALVFRLVCFIAVLALGASVVHAAEDLNAVKARMEQRQSSVDQLKDQQLVGENNRGFLEPRASLTGEQQRVVSDENADRRIVYVAIAQQTGTDPDTVGRARAQKIAINSKRGVWVQGPDGNWYQKN